jgi:hypothetical protein
MSQTRFRQIARLEKLAQPYFQRKQQIEKEWQAIPRGAARHAAILAFVIRYGDPKIGEPLSCAWERFINTDVWKECCDKWEAMQLKQLADWKEKNGEDTSPRNLSRFLSQSYKRSPYDRDGVTLTGDYFRHELIARFPGATEKEKLEQVFASAPPWLIWFTFADYTAGLLGLPLPNLSTVADCARSKADFNNWYGLPSGAFIPRPWPNGPNNEPLARTDLNLLRPTTERLINPKTRREHRRAHAVYMKTSSAKIGEDWPEFLSLEELTMPEEKLEKLYPL